MRRIEVFFKLTRITCNPKEIRSKGVITTLILLECKQNILQNQMIFCGLISNQFPQCVSDWRDELEINTARDLSTDFQNK